MHIQTDFPVLVTIQCLCQVFVQTAERDIN